MGRTWEQGCQQSMHMLRRCTMIARAHAHPYQEVRGHFRFYHLITPFMSIEICIRELLSGLYLVNNSI